jgi:hypothetical protein
MKVAVFGSNGSMGKRYMAILKFLKIKAVPIEIGDTWDSTTFDRAIVAIPTDDHFDLLTELLPLNKPILCEKPLSKDLKEIKILENLDKYGWIRVVSNWNFLPQVLFIHNEVEYDHYNTGKDGLFWDCCQLLMIARDSKCEIKNTSPVFKATINNLSVSLDDIAMSYVTMVQRWMVNKNDLWILSDAYEMSSRVINRIGQEAPCNVLPMFPMVGQ